MAPGDVIEVSIKEPGRAVPTWAGEAELVRYDPADGMWLLRPVAGRQPMPRSFWMKIREDG